MTYTTPPLLHVFPADDGGVFVRSDHLSVEACLEAAHATAGVVLTATQSNDYLHRGKLMKMSRCLVSDVQNGVGEEPGWWREDGSGITLSFAYWGDDVLAEWYDLRRSAALPTWTVS